MKDIWGNKFTTIAPRNFKDRIGEFAPRFSGYDQHDSNELLAFLLDGLHEDLNKVKTKPMTQTVESKGRADDDVATEAWATHLLRNQLKSNLRYLFRLVCVCVCGGGGGGGGWGYPPNPPQIAKKIKK